MRAGRARGRGEVDHAVHAAHRALDVAELPDVAAPEIEAVVETPEQRPWRSGGETVEHDDAVNLVPGLQRGTGQLPM